MQTAKEVVFELGMAATSTVLGIALTGWYLIRRNNRLPKKTISNTQYIKLWASIALMVVLAYTIVGTIVYAVFSYYQHNQ